MAFLQHVVFLRFAREPSTEDMVAMNEQMKRIVNAIDGMVCGQITKNEYSTRTQGYTNALFCLFTNVEALKIYADHPEHIKLKKMAGKFINSDSKLPNLAVIDSWTDVFTSNAFKSKL